MEYFKVIGEKIEKIDVYFGYDLRNRLISSTEGRNNDGGEDRGSVVKKKNHLFADGFSGQIY
ncbi:hypothetical protein GCM10008935_19310 [Alkalibacillus silvisoli]|uniref:Uncharacterized protein n=1 Tax=Alkalibacillus silvisoli TaxID=392823 RepID=A0ABP3JV21_9BACI